MTAGEPHPEALGRIVRPADYARVLATPLRLRSAHFAVHHLEGRPLPPNRPGLRSPAPAADAPRAEPAPTAGRPPDNASLSTELSTEVYTVGDPDVDDLCSAAISGSGPQCWLGLVVPKRHAKRAVTRTLLKRQIRAVFGDLPELPPGLWVVRLRMPFERKQFPSASSDALRTAARAELLQLTRKLARPPASAPVG